MYKKSYRTCVFCSSDIVSSRHKDHESKCLKMSAIRESKQVKVGRPKGIDAWNKGLTSATDDRVKLNSINVGSVIRKQVADGTYIPRKMGESARLALSERQSLNNTGGRSKWYMVAGQRVQGTYEKRFAEQLELDCIKWFKVKTNNHIFKYVSNGLSKSYAPDFYLPDLNLYVEIKGFWWGNDEEKMRIIASQHADKNVIIIFGKDKLEEICKSINEFLPLETPWSW